MLFLSTGLLVTGCSDKTSVAPANSENYRVEAPLADTTNIVFVLPVEGLKDPARLVLADALAASLRDAARPAVLSDEANDQGPSIVGKITEIRKRGSVAWITVSWELRAPYGTTVSQATHEVVVDRLLWEESGVEAINLVIAEAEPHIIGMVSDHVGPLSSTELVAMPPEARMTEPLPSGVMLERPGGGAEPGITDQELEEMMPDPQPMSGDGSLTDDDIAAQPPVPPSSGPTRLMPRGVAANGFEAEEPDDAIELPADEPEMPGAETELMNDRDDVVSDEMAGVPDNTRLAPVVWGRPTFLIRPVAGAPGDGNEALTSAIKSVMRQKDLTVTEDPRQAGYEVVGQVTVGPPVNGRQQARIVWKVSTVTGDEVGKAIQENAVIAGSLDGEWGRVAELVSVAAVNGIEGLFDKEGVPKRRGAGEPDFSRTPQLRQTPGRAPPPPGS